MIYKILLIKNRYTGIVNINKYLDWFKQNTPIEISMDTLLTDFDVTTFKAQNATYSGVVVGKEIIPKLQTVVPENKYNAVIFLYGNSLNGIRVSSTNIMGLDPLYKDTELIQTWQGNDSGKVINHELFHAFFFKAKKLQINVVDNMDKYNGDTDFLINGVIDTNRETALQTLKPYWAQICAFRNVTPVTSQLPLVTITRKTSTSKETLGELRHGNGLFGCDSLELPWLNNQKNISCIPTGEYLCKWTYSLKFPFGSYEVMNVKGRSGIRFHTGNFWSDIEGCILLGSLPKDINKDGQIDLQNSRLIINAFNSYMGKRPFSLIIK